MVLYLYEEEDGEGEEEGGGGEEGMSGGLGSGVLAILNSLGGLFQEGGSWIRQHRMENRP